MSIVELERRLVHRIRRKVDFTSDLGFAMKKMVIKIAKILLQKRKGRFVVKDFKFVLLSNRAFSEVTAKL